MIPDARSKPLHFPA